MTYHNVPSTSKTIPRNLGASDFDAEDDSGAKRRCLRIADSTMLLYVLEDKLRKARIESQ